ncbi:MAG: alpha/beta hydrolase [Gracilibacteraceae bacterium]|jgi:acetyl esterase/lipase|nr:alpha/beta hydrolase [Gracilibacteraceae bacterium]
MAKNYFERALDPELSGVLTNPPSYLAAWTDENVAKKTPRDITFPPAPPTPPDPEVNFYNKLIPGPPGAPEVRVRIYEPRTKAETLPGVLYLHYGGYSIGTPEHEDLNCIRYVKEIKCVVVSVDYRLAPENPAPAAYEDCYAALLWFAENAKVLGVDAARIAVTGFSAGGGLTVATVLLARDRKGPAIAFQMPLAPTIDDRLLTKSTVEFTDKRGLNYESCRNIWNQYLGAGHETRTDISIYAAPARCTDYSNLPPCYAFVGGLDPHRDETIAYISNLVQAGVPATFSLYAGGLHGFDLENPDAAISRHAVKTSTWALKRALRS